MGETICGNCNYEFDIDLWQPHLFKFCPICGVEWDKDW